MGCTLSSNEEYFSIAPLPLNCSLETWLSWKENLQAIIANEIETELPNKLGYKLEESIGSYGQKIIRNFCIDNNQRHNFYILLRKLDLFFYLNGIKRNQGEKIGDYVQRLVVRANQWGSQRPLQAVKEHLIFDLKNINFLNTISKYVLMRIDIMDLKILNIEELTFLISVYDNRECIQAKKVYLQKQQTNNGFRYNQNCCGQQHNELDECIALGKRCFICNNLNHFARVCQAPYVMARLLIPYR
ncbi:uncharacterized protein LOC122511203 [Leptopilina heterotoma]|uniref:uncharacterized protein LOC122511203 n=1 Tax=Leptopilina heterotoma TaxID=63436 RepID=UPI001CAA24B5|nr:uncharacterized protein LOC122511203 [Leptopilina heterotoma]